MKEGPIYRITTIKDTSRLPLAFRVDPDGGALTESDRIVTQVIGLRYTNPADMINIISPFLSPGGTIVAHDDSRTLIVVDKSANVRKALRLVDTFDIDLFRNTNYSFFFLQNADAEETANVLEDAFSLSSGAGKGMVRFITIKRLNAILALSENRQVFDRIDQLVAKIDTEATAAEPQIYVYFVKNGEATNLASLLEQVFTKGSAEAPQTEQPVEPETIPAPYTTPNLDAGPVVIETSAGDPAGVTTIPASAQAGASPMPEASSRPTAYQPEYAAPAASPAQPQKPKSTALGPDRSSTLKGQVKIVADEIRNAIIIEAIPIDYGILKSVLDRIDVLPRQVLIEATIAEIKLDESSDLERIGCTRAAAVLETNCED